MATNLRRWIIPLNLLNLKMRRCLFKTYVSEMEYFFKMLIKRNLIPLTIKNNNF